MQSTLEIFSVRKKTKGPTSKRAYLIQAIADSIKVPFNNVFKEVYHLKGEEGNKVLQIILDDTLMSGDDVNWRAITCRKLIDKSRA